jgi:hypothetical protein
MIKYGFFFLVFLFQSINRHWERIRNQYAYIFEHVIPWHFPWQKCVYMSSPWSIYRTKFFFAIRFSSSSSSSLTYHLKLSSQENEHLAYNHLYSIRNTTRLMIPYRRPTTMPQIRLDWLEKFGLIKRTSTSTTTHYFKQRF